MNDSTFWQPKNEKWRQEWDETFANDLAAVDEKVAYWTDYKKKNSLSRFAKVELSNLYITYYEYIGKPSAIFRKKILRKHETKLQF